LGGCSIDTIGAGFKVACSGLKAGIDLEIISGFSAAGGAETFVWLLSSADEIFSGSVSKVFWLVVPAEWFCLELEKNQVPARITRMQATPVPITSKVLFLAE
jgi:hypothetical protein